MSVRRTAWVPIAAFWSALALLLATQTWLSMITHGHSLPRMIGYQLAVWSVWVLLTPLVFSLTQRFPPIPFRFRNWLLHGAAALAIAPAHVAIWVSLTILFKPYDAMTETRFAPYFPQSILARFPLEILIYLAAVGAAQILALQSRAAGLERSLSAARLHALELQIQPHFLFNTLNAISALVRARKNSEAVEVIAGLSDLLRYTLDHAGEQRVPLEQEAAMLGRYLEIQRVRFPDRLNVKIDVAEDVRRAAVPMLILQPLAENAIRHGVAMSAAAGRIEVRAFRRDGALRIEMFNTGTLADAPRGIGLRNTEERLRQLYADGYRFDLRNTEGGVLAEMSIPWSVVA
jgi:hypothetical protein